MSGSTRCPGNDWAADFRVQSYRSQPVPTWWQGNVNAGVGAGAGAGAGEDMIFYRSYRQIAIVRAGNG